MTRVLQPRRLSVKLALVIFGVVTGALAIVYLAVVPQLESRLVGAKMDELERRLPTVVRDLQGRNAFLYQDRVEVYSSTLDVRVVVFARGNESTLLAIADSSGVLSSDVARDPIAMKAAETRLSAAGRVTRKGRTFAEVARPLDPETVVLLSAPLTDALSNVALVRQSVLVAGLVALLVSGLAGLLASWGFTGRLRRLERAAERIANGNFGEAVVDRGRDEVAQLARAFEGMRVRLARLDRARREFIANASHELRTPLFSLGGFLELLDDEDVDEDTRREFLRETRAQVERLTKLATDLLDLSRMDAGQLEVEADDVDLAAAARLVADEFRPFAESSLHPLTVEADASAHTLADEQRVLQVARILVENALRHTPGGTPVDVSVAVAGERVLLTVRDAGPGIAPAEQGHVFERFYRGRDGVASGSGLGLAIASELAARMGGELTFRSHPGETVFTLSLPLSDERAFPRENGGVVVGVGEESQERDAPATAERA
ncbi:MAG: HAMP domain-containing histidine kinase [Actinomycetota bacterium]|nr:HAMP domain-containing histidine kinase [Actinomycetota bacterium]